MLANAISLAADRTLTDNSVIARILSGQKDDFEILIRRYNNLLYRTARGILVEEKDIEDAMQEAYIKGFEKLHQFRQEALFSTWLTRILINCALKVLNKQKGKEHLDIDSLNSADSDSLHDVTDEPVNESVGENLKKAVESAVNQLSPKYRMVFILREIQQIPVLETATILGITEENVKVRLHRSKAMLKEILRAELSSLEIFEFHQTRCALMASKVMKLLS